MSKPNQTALDAAKAALDAHDEVYGLETNADPDVQVWHLVASLLEYCDAHTIDFDALVSEVRADLIQD